MECEGPLLNLQMPTTCPYPEPDQSSPCPSIQKIHLNIIPLCMPVPSNWSLSLRFLHQNLLCTLSSPLLHTCYVPRPSHSSSFVHMNNIWWGVSFSLCSFLHSPVTSPLLGSSILLSTLFSNTLSLRCPLNVTNQVSNPYKITSKIIVLHILIFIFLDSKLEDNRFCTKL
jgi:hypothetical protein